MFYYIWHICNEMYRSIRNFKPYHSYCFLNARRNWHFWHWHLKNEKSKLPKWFVILFGNNFFEVNRQLPRFLKIFFHSLEPKGKASFGSLCPKIILILNLLTEISLRVWKIINFKNTRMISENFMSHWTHFV